MRNQFLTIGTSQSLHAFSLIFNTEGIPYKKSQNKITQGLSLITIEEFCKTKGIFNLPLFFCPSVEIDKDKQRIEEIFEITFQDFTPALKGTLKLKDDSLFNKTNKTLKSFGFSQVEIPIDGILDLDVGTNSQVLAEIEVEGKSFPALIQKGDKFLLTFDLGKSFLTLLSETYFESQEERKPLSPLANLIYKIVPYPLRLLTYRKLLKRIKSKLNSTPYFTTHNPIDPAGWTIYQMYIDVINYSLHYVPRIWKWPSNYSYAFCFTHDIEPRKYAYYKGLPTLIDNLRELDIEATISIVAKPPFSLPEETVKKIKKEGHDLISHGLYHNGTFNTITSRDRAYQIRKSREKLAKITECQVKGFRAPWLQRTSDLAQLLEEQHFTFDSSLPDVDTSLKVSWHGKGISFNFPFKMFRSNGKIKQYKVLELPLTGPQDMEPFFSGLSFKESKEIFKLKHSWLKTIGGLYVFLAHAGVYGEADSKLRTELLHYLHNLLKNQRVWLAKLSQISNWWLRREQLVINTLSSSHLQGAVLEVRNQGPQTVSDFSLALSSKSAIKEVKVDDKASKVSKQNGLSLIPIKALKAGEKVKVGLSFVKQ